MKWQMFSYGFFTCLYLLVLYALIYSEITLGKNYVIKEHPVVYGLTVFVTTVALINVILLALNK